jgi:hypothetical protein
MDRWMEGRVGRGELGGCCHTRARHARPLPHSHVPPSKVAFMFSAEMVRKRAFVAALKRVATTGAILSDGYQRPAAVLQWPSRRSEMPASAAPAGEDGDDSVSDGTAEFDVMIAELWPTATSPTSRVCGGGVDDPGWAVDVRRSPATAL